MRNLLFIFFCSFNFLISQNDPIAEKIVADVLKKINEANTIKVKFTLIQKNTKEYGTLELKGNKFRLDFMGIKQLSDSKNIYTIIDSNQEVIVSKIDEDDNSLKPSNLFNFFKNGYHYKNLITNNNANNTVIKLIPIENSKKENELLLKIDYDKKEIIEISEVNNSNSLVVKINSILFNSKLNNENFTFNKLHYSNYYIESVEL